MEWIKAKRTASRPRARGACGQPVAQSPRRGPGVLVWGHDPSREAQQVKRDMWWPYFPRGPLLLLLTSVFWCGLSPLCPRRSSGFSRIQKLPQKAELPAAAHPACSLAAASLQTVFPCSCFIAILETPIKQAEMGKTPGETREGLGLGPACATARSWGVLHCSAACWDGSNLAPLATKYDISHLLAPSSSVTHAQATWWQHQ